MNETTPLNTPRMIYHWKEERKGNLECHLRISVPLRRRELWGGFGNRPEFSEINAHKKASGVRAKAVVLLEVPGKLWSAEDGFYSLRMFFCRSRTYTHLIFLSAEFFAKTPCLCYADSQNL